jgi:hypothetical protein
VGTERSLEFCREIETYLCQKNDGHLIRVTGPSFDLVSSWAEKGVPLKVAFAGIDRYFERYYRQGPRRRPVRIDFCEADVLDLFDEWRRAVGIVQSTVDRQRSTDSRQSTVNSRQSSVGSRQSLPEHLERVVTRLSSARANGSLGAEFDAVIDAVARELDAARASASGVRGDARKALIDRLSALDADLLRQARTLVDDAARTALAREANEELAAFRASMPADAFARAHDAAVDRLIRDRFGLPTVAYNH